MKGKWEAGFKEGQYKSPVGNIALLQLFDHLLRVTHILDIYQQLLTKNETTAVTTMFMNIYEYLYNNQWNVFL